MKTKSANKAFGRNSEFQNKYRKEINDIISGVEYLDKLMPNGSKSKSPQKDQTNISKCAMTPEDKRKLMFQKPVTLIKRQTNYYIAKNSMKSPINPKDNIKKDENNNTNSQANVSPRFPKSSQHTNKSSKQTTTNKKVQIIQNPRSNTEEETPKKITKQCSNQSSLKKVTIEHETKKEFPVQSHNQASNMPNKNSDVYNERNSKNNKTPNRLSISKNDFINDHISEQSIESYNQSSDYQSYMSYYFDRSFNKYTIPEENNSQNEEESSESFDYQEMHSQIPIENETRSISNNRFSMISSGMIEAEVDFSSECSEDNEFQDQFFIQENVNQSDSEFDQNRDQEGFFISSGAIEPFSES